MATAGSSPQREQTPSAPLLPPSIPQKRTLEDDYGAPLQRVAAHRGVRDDDLRRISRDIEATLLDSGRKSIAWNDIVSLALDRLANIDAVAAQRLAANYTDESGAIRFDQSSASGESPQLGLPLTDDD